VSDGAGDRDGFGPGQSRFPSQGTHGGPRPRPPAPDGNLPPSTAPDGSTNPDGSGDTSGGIAS